MKVIIGVEQEPRIQFSLEIGDHNVPPRVIILTPGNEMLIRNGSYADGTGNTWRYDRAGNAIQLDAVKVKDWPKQTKLIG